MTGNESINKDKVNMSKEFEHSYLRNEIETNKKMVFERALLIAGAALAATLLPKDAKGIELLGIPSLGALVFNLWFTVNRLKSNMRIIAYIQLFHESDRNLPWIGWENSLRIYRIWLKKCKGDATETKTKLSNITQYDNLSFYIPIFTLHIAMALAIVLFMSFRAWSTGPYQTTTCELPISYFLILNSVAFVIFVICVLVFHRPYELKHGIEKNRILWIAVIKSYKTGCLKKILDEELPNNANARAKINSRPWDKDPMIF